MTTIEQLQTDYVEGLSGAKEYAGRSHTSIQNWVNAGLIHPLQFGRTKYYEKRELDKVKEQMADNLRISRENLGKNK